MKRLTLYLPTEVKGREGFSEVGEGVTVGLAHFPSWGVQRGAERQEMEEFVQVRIITNAKDTHLTRVSSSFN